MSNISKENKKLAKNWFIKNIDKYNLSTWDDEDDSYKLFEDLHKDTSINYEDKLYYREVFTLAMKIKDEI